MSHANIEAGIEHVCNISNRNFQKFPMAFRAGQFVDDTFYCRQFDLYNVESIETYYGSHQSQCTSTSRCYQKMESQRIEFTFEEYPLLNMGTLYIPIICHHATIS